MTTAPVDVLIVNFNTAHLLGRMFAHLQRAAATVPVRCLVVDNASTDGSVARIRADFPQARLIANDVNVGFGRANNQLLPFLSGRYVLLLNTDAFVAPDTLSKTVAYMDAHSDCGVLGVRLEGRDGAPQPGCRQFPTPWSVFATRTGLSRWFLRGASTDEMAWSPGCVRECDWVPGCYYLVRRTVIEQVGLFDPRYFLYCEEVDHCRRVRSAGWKVVFFPDTSVVHIGGESAQSTGTLSASGRQIVALQLESELLYFRKHHGVWGLCAHLSLTFVADAYLALKDLIKGRGWQAAAQHLRHARLTWELCRRTQWASEPTR